MLIGVNNTFKTRFQPLTSAASQEAAAPPLNILSQRLGTRDI